MALERARHFISGSIPEPCDDIPILYQEGSNEDFL
jgi:hypothetical protein